MQLISIHRQLDLTLSRSENLISQLGINPRTSLRHSIDKTDCEPNENHEASVLILEASLPQSIVICMKENPAV